MTKRERERDKKKLKWSLMQMPNFKTLEGRVNRNMNWNMENIVRLSRNMNWNMEDIDLAET